MRINEIFHAYGFKIFIFMALNRNIEEVLFVKLHVNDEFQDYAEDKRASLV